MRAPCKEVQKASQRHLHLPHSFLVQDRGLALAVGDTRTRQLVTLPKYEVPVQMVLILCIGDLHIPHRTPDLPPQFKELLKPGKIHSILCAGNLCSKTVLDYLRNICPDVTLVQGDFDEFTSPDQAVLTFGDLKIGLIHGHQVIPYGNPSALARLHRQMAVDILVTAHTHEHKIGRTDEGLTITLGSATGAYSSFAGEVTPSFVLLDVDGPKATVYVYQLKEGKVKVDRSDFTKAVAPIPA